MQLINVNKTLNLQDTVIFPHRYKFRPSETKPDPLRKMKETGALPAHTEQNPSPLHSNTYGSLKFEQLY